MGSEMCIRDRCSLMHRGSRITFYRRDMTHKRQAQTQQHGSNRRTKSSSGRNSSSSSGGGDGGGAAAAVAASSPLESENDDLLCLSCRSLVSMQLQPLRIQKAVAAVRVRIREIKTSVRVGHEVVGWRYADLSSAPRAQEGSHPLAGFGCRLTGGRHRNGCFTNLAPDNMKNRAANILCACESLACVVNSIAVSYTHLTLPTILLV